VREQQNVEERSTTVRRVAAAAAVGLAAAVATAVLLANGDGYRVRMLFQNAGQLVKGNQLKVSGAPMGTVEDITLTRDGQAEVLTKVEEQYAPLRQGTKATIRHTSLSGIANRYIELQLAPATAPAIPNGGVIGQQHTTTIVDLDEIFNVFDRRSRRSLQGVLKGFATLYAGRTQQTHRGVVYANPSIASTSRLMRELNHDEPGLRSFLRDTARLMSDIDERREHLSQLIVNLEQTTGAIASRDDELQSAVRQLPDFMRRANTTFVNLRSTLDDLDPLVEESKPVAKKLRPFLAQLRPLARDARPTLRDLATLISAPGDDNDLIEATAGNVPVRDIAIGPVRRNGEQRRGAFGESVNALQGSTENLEFAKPYAVDLTGWFDGFAHSGYYDALGSVGRIAVNVNAFAIVNGLPAIPLLPNQQALKDQLFQDNLSVHQDNRCPGSSERNFDGSNPWVPAPLSPKEDGGCDPSQVPQGTKHGTSP
jgi:phospholipid/cholesterol/gamma-HCH transport system substrate-binding protein